MPKKLSVEYVDRVLASKNIQRLDEFVNTKTPGNFGCLEHGCSCIWKTTPEKVLHKTGCPRCHGCEELTNDIIDRRLLGREIKRLGNCAGARGYIDFQCKICNHIWNAFTDSVIGHMQSGCPKCCGTMRITNEIADERLKKKNIERLCDIDSGSSEHKFRCTKCKYIWNTSVIRITLAIIGCPFCANVAKLTNKIVDERLSNTSIKRIDNVIGCDRKINFQCLLCNDILFSTPGNLFDNEIDCCQKCRTQTNEKIIVSLLIKNGISFDLHRSTRDIIPGEVRRLHIDFYFPDLKMAIEYNGGQHYGPVRFGGISQERADANFIKQQERDEYLQTLCNINNIELIWIDGRIYTNSKLEKYVIEEILPKVKSK